MTTSEALRLLLTHKDPVVRQAALAIEKDYYTRPGWAQEQDARGTVPEFLRRQAG